MPEGDTIYRTAELLRPAMVGQRVVDAAARIPGPAVAAIVGSTVTGVRAQGKHLFMSFDNGLVLHSHMGMLGRWRVVPLAREVRPGAAVRLVLRLTTVQVVCYNAPTMELVRERALAAHPSVSQLGPDLLSPDFDPELGREQPERWSAPRADDRRRAHGPAGPRRDRERLQVRSPVHGTGAPRRDGGLARRGNTPASGRPRTEAVVREPGHLPAADGGDDGGYRRSPLGIRAYRPALRALPRDHSVGEEATAGADDVLCPGCQREVTAPA